MAEMQLRSEQLWRWMDEYHWKNWHGIWVHWEPFKSREVNKSYRSVRSLQATNEERSIMRHQNQWYDPRGVGEANKWMFGPWILNEQEHCLHNGIVHPNIAIARTLIFPNGDLAWLPLKLNFPGPTVVAAEVHFMLPEKDRRMAVIFRFSVEGELGASLISEDALDSAERPDPSWSGNFWKHELVRRSLEESREEPEGKFVGTELLLTTSLVLTTTENVCWEGFKGGLIRGEDDPEDYTLICLPYDFTGCVRKKVVEGEPLAFAVHWVVSEDEVRSIYWRYSAEGKLLHIKSAKYHRQAS